MIIDVFELVTIMALPVTIMALLFCKNLLKIQSLKNVKIVFRNLVGDFLQPLQPAEIPPRSLHVQGCRHFPKNYIEVD